MLPAIEQQDRQEALFSQLDDLAKTLSVSSLQFGWVAVELWNVVQEDFISQADGKEKKALTAFIDLIHERESKEIESRKIVAERIRIAKYVTRETYSAIVSGSNGTEPTFHQIRACVFTQGQELEKEKTTAMIDWCVSHNWPSVTDIRIQRGVIEPTLKVDPAKRHFSTFVKLAQCVMADSGEGTERYNVASTVVELWQKENNLAISK
jgi:hypothetical protein